MGAEGGTEDGSEADPLLRIGEEALRGALHHPGTTTTEHDAGRIARRAMLAVSQAVRTAGYALVRLEDVPEIATVRAAFDDTDAEPPRRCPWNGAEMCDFCGIRYGETCPATPHGGYDQGCFERIRP